MNDLLQFDLFPCLVTVIQLTGLPYLVIMAQKSHKKSYCPIMPFVRAWQTMCTACHLVCHSVIRSKKYSNSLNTAHSSFLLMCIFSVSCAVIKRQGGEPSPCFLPTPIQSRVVYCSVKSVSICLVIARFNQP